MMGIVFLCFCFCLCFNLPSQRRCVVSRVEPFPRLVEPFPGRANRGGDKLFPPRLLDVHGQSERSE